MSSKLSILRKVKTQQKNTAVLLFSRISRQLNTFFKCNSVCCFVILLQRKIAEKKTNQRILVFAKALSSQKPELMTITKNNVQGISKLGIDIEAVYCINKNKKNCVNMYRDKFLLLELFPPKGTTLKMIYVHIFFTFY